VRKEFKTGCRVVPEEGPVDVLLYVGCSASYNSDVHKIARSVVMLMEKMDIRYGILKEENCCGSPARQIGEQGLFEEFSETNIQAFQSTGAKTIVTISPHCYHSFINEYPVDMRQFEIKHFTEFFSKSIQDKKMVPKSGFEKTVAYHDPCYLGKRNSLYAPPRKILESIPGIQVIELKRNRENSRCCGGGGGRMWMDIEEVIRPSEIKVNEVLAAGAQVLVTACPWCYLQIEDAIKTTGCEGKLEVKDISEILLASL
jgi:Fe-S oxidoreductase